MGEAPRTRWPLSDLDAWLVTASALGLAAVAWLLAAGPERAASPPGTGSAVASLAFATGAVLHRPRGSLAWEGARPGQVLHEEEALYVPPGGIATVAFRGGATLDVEERSLVMLEPGPGAGEAGLELLRGAVSGRAEAGALAVRAPAGRAVLGRGAEGRLSVDRAGSVRLDLAAGAGRVEGRAAAAARGVALSAPPRGDRFWLSERNPVARLRWNGAEARGLLAEVARDRAFSEKLASAAGAAGALDFRPPRPGVYYWRIADARGAPRSEVRHLVVLEDRPPAPFTPAAGEMVLAPPGRPIAFWWTAVEGAPGYRMQIADDPSFPAPVFEAGSDGPGLWASPRLAEGVYYWRVRVAGREESPFSTPSPFRVIHAPVPAAPVLFEPAIEVERAGD